MKLPFSLPFGKKEKIEYFLALLLRDEKASAVIFEEINGKIKIIGDHEEYFSDSIDNISLDEFIEILDKTISIVESVLPPNIETKKTIFGLKENWIEESHIKKEYLAKLKRASKELGLFPIGFLVIHEAIAHLLQEEEGVPISAILIEIDKKNLAISLLRGGKIVETKRAKIENSIPETTDKLLHSFTNYEVLPARIIIFNDKDSEKISQQFINHQWSKSLPFLHMPQTTPLPSGFDAKAVVSGVATQMGFEVLGEEIEPQEKSINKTTEFKARETPSEDFGFLKEEDIAQKNVIDEEPVKEKITFEETPQPEEQTLKAKSFRVFNFLKNSLTKIISSVNFSFVKKVRIPNFGFLNRRNKIILFLSIFILFLIAVVFFYLFFIRAIVVIKINPKIIEQDQKITFSLTSATDFSKNLIRGETISTEIEGKSTAQTTGKKEVGEKAKGAITIYNSSLTEGKNLPKGTIVTSVNNLQFILDNAVTIASASGDAISRTPATVKVAVTAKDIGKESNLPSGTKFTINSFLTSEILAKNDSVFSGGSKKTITAVSKEDLDKLISDLPKNLEKKAKDDFSKKAGDNKSVLPIFTNTSIEKKELSNQVGDEANSITLKAIVRFEGLAYQNKDIEDFIKNLIKNKVSDNYTLSKDEIKTDIKDLQVKENKEIDAILNIKAGLIPNIDISKLTQEISGKSFDQTKAIISKYPQVGGLEINLNPSFPIFPKILPRFSSNISIKTVKNE